MASLAVVVKGMSLVVIGAGTVFMLWEFLIAMSEE